MSAEAAEEEKPKIFSKSRHGACFADCFKKAVGLCKMTEQKMYYCKLVRACGKPHVRISGFVKQAYVAQQNVMISEVL